MEEAEDSVCWWCAYPVGDQGPPVRLTRSPHLKKAVWCGGNCAMSYFQTYRRGREVSYDWERQIQEALDMPSDATWRCAPEPQGYVWWGGQRSRREFLLHCKTIFLHQEHAKRPGYQVDIRNAGPSLQVFLATRPLSAAEPTPDDPNAQGRGE